MNEKKNGFKEPAIKFVTILLLFLSAFSIRLYHINKAPMDFAPIRQYQQAHIARNYYLKDIEAVPEWKREIAKLNAQRMGFELEPRIVEHLAVFGYCLTGGEHLWFPRIMSSVFWIIGGVFLYLIAGKLFSPEAAFFSAAFYLFLPYSIPASRSFQPDPLMTMLLIISIYMMLKYFERPSLYGIIIAALASTLTMLLKPNCVLFIFGAFIPLAVVHYGIRKFIANRDVWLFAFLSVMPAAAFYLSGLITNTGFVQEHTRSTFVPHLIFLPYFWRDWFYIIGQVFGFIPFIAALIGLFMMQDRQPRFMLSGLWTGYFIFGLLFTFHIHTHSYYQLPFIPIVALSIGPVGLSMLKFVSTHKRKIITGMGVILLVFVLVFNMKNIQSAEYKDELKFIGAFVGINTEVRQFIANDFEKEVKINRDIGNIVGHSKNTLFLTSDFGRTLAYHGELSGLPWPITSSLRERSERGVEIPPKEELFNRRYFTIRTHGKYTHYTPDYFIVTAMDELDKQTDLKEFLFSNFPVITVNKDYLVFDLRSMSGGNI